MSDAEPPAAQRKFSRSIERAHSTGRVRLWTAQQLRLYHYKARVYDPGLGRFLQTDPVGYEDDLNLYTYVLNDPLNRTDPTGRQNMALEAQREVAETRILERCPDADCVREEIEALNQREAQNAGIALSLFPLGSAVRFLGVSLSGPRTFAQAQSIISRLATPLGRTGGRSGRVTDQFAGEGGSRAAQGLFNRLSGGRSRDLANGGQIGQLRGGGTVQISTRTTADGVVETSVRVSVQRTGSRITQHIKVRFSEPAQ